MFHVTPYGLEVSGTPIVVQVLPEFGLYWNVAETTPEPSAELEVTLTALPRTFAPAVGAVIEPVGFVVSYLNMEVAGEDTLPTASVARATIVYVTPSLRLAVVKARVQLVVPVAGRFVEPVSHWPVLVPAVPFQ